MPPAAADQFAAAIPDGVLDLVVGVGHHVEVEAPNRVARAIRAAVGPR
jgi:pimeloyl-ACP methyl ester carboxylesterase